MKQQFLLVVLREKLPAWHFEEYGTEGAVACYPPDKIGWQRWHELAEWAVISSVCGPLYVVTQFQTPADAEVASGVARLNKIL